MASSLAAARSFAESVRYSGDSLRHQSDGDRRLHSRVLGVAAFNELQISAAVTPGLSARLDDVCAHLGLPRESVTAFIYAAPTIQAECFSATIDTCILRFSSTLIDGLSEKEFCFVAGHELGHFLLGHGLARLEGVTQSLEYLIQRHAQEISADRVGLIACGSLEVAVQAMMKTLSGLSDRHLRFDTSAFIRQLNLAAEESADDPTRILASHPSMLVRCRALLWFSLVERQVNAFRSPEQEVRRVDTRICKDLERSIDGYAARIIEAAKKHLLLWMCAQEAAQDGTLDKREQSVIQHLVGLEALTKLKRFLGGIASTEVQPVVLSKLQEARSELEQLIPTEFERAYRELRTLAQTVVRH